MRGRPVLRIGAIVGGIIASAVVVSAVLVHAAFTDSARLEARVGGVYENVVVDGEGVVVARYRGTHSASVSADQFAPGDTAVVRLRIAPNSPVRSKLRLAVSSESDVATSLRFSVSRHDSATGETVILGDPSQPAQGAVISEPLDVDAGALGAHGGDPVAVGANAEASEIVTFLLIVRFCDDPSLRTRASAHTTITYSLTGDS